MILVIIGIWLGFLWLLVKVGVLKGWSLWMKVSPVVIWALATLMIFIPLNWNSPVGPATVTIGSVQITPNVSGKVDEVLVKSRVLIPKGELLFRIDPTRYEATLRQAIQQLWRSVGKQRQRQVYRLVTGRITYCLQQMRLAC